MPAGVGLEVVILLVLVALLVGAFFLGQYYRRLPPPEPRRMRQSLGVRLKGLVGKDRLTDEDWDRLEEGLVRADAGPLAAKEIVTRVRERHEPGQDAAELLSDEIGRIFHGDPPFELPDRLSVVMVVGVNGTGKTTTIGKLAHLLARQGRSVALAASDTFRAGAGAQLGVWSKRAGADMVASQRGGDPGAVAHDAVEAATSRKHDVLIVDTAGRLHSREPLMEELEKVKRVLEKASGREVDEVLLVLDATTGQNGIAQARAFTESVGVTGIALAKLDGTAKGGVVLAIREELGVPVKLIGTGEKIEDLEPFDPQVFARSMVEG
jgi:fused signal recognition particle receptor